MPVQPADYMKLAQTLLVGGDEIHYRAAVSRAYYATFSLAVEVLNRGGDSPSLIGESHNNVWDYFASDKDKKGQSLRDKGLILKSVRRKADYQLSATLTKAQAELTIQQASDLFQLLEQLK